MHYNELKKAFRINRNLNTKVFNILKSAKPCSSGLVPILFFSLLLIHASSFSQTDSLCTELCSCNDDPSPPGLMMTKVHDKGEWMIAYHFMQMQMGHSMHENHMLGDDAVLHAYSMAPVSMKMNMHMLMAMYGITDRLTAMATVNYYASSMKMKSSVHTEHHASGTSIHDVQSSGPGDASLHVLYAVVHTPSCQLAAGTGLGVPSGSINEGTSSRLPYSMQPGSGSWTMMPLVTWTFSHNKFTFGTMAEASMALNKNRYGYSHGNKYIISAWTARMLLPWLSAAIRGEYVYSDHINGSDNELYIYSEPLANPENYKGMSGTVNLSAIAHFNSGCLKNHRVGAEFGIPVFLQSSGIGQTVQHVLGITWGYTF